MATSPTIGTNPSPIGNSTQPKSSMTGRRKLTWKPFWLESLTGYTGDVLDSDTLDSYVEEECSADKNLYEAYLVYKEARDTLNQVRRGRGFWSVIAIPSPDGRSATLAVRANDESFRVKGKDSKGTTHKGKSKGNKSGKSGKNKGGKGKSSGKSNVKK